MAETEPEREVTAEPVTGFGHFTWRTGRWEQIFDSQVGVIKRELARAHAEDRVVVYLSCPISPRGGGIPATNVAIANFTARRLMHTWGERLHVINPAAYQMESREGTGLVLDRIAELWHPADSQDHLDQLTAEYEPEGGDYMRMWVRVLVEDDLYPDGAAGEETKRGQACGGMFDAFYFLGPSDVRSFFATGDESSLTQVVESYFARKYAIDPEFRKQFDVPESSWEHRRKRFFRYYALRAGAAYSLGSRDEWNTLVRLNRKRRESGAYGPGEELACYFDGRQVSPASANRTVPRGYEKPPPGDSSGEAS
jgi:hypothetical protein